MKFVLTEPAPDAVAAITYLGHTWPQWTITAARRVAKECGVGGFWRVKR